MAKFPINPKIRNIITKYTKPVDGEENKYESAQTCGMTPMPKANNITHKKRP